jgi:hypothetical protein
MEAFEVVVADDLATGIVIVAGEIPRTIRWMRARPPSRDAPAHGPPREAITVRDLRPRTHRRTLARCVSGVACPEACKRTPLVEDLPDQDALHGVLSRIESLRFELLDVRPDGSDPDEVMRDA